jgi:chitin disaccharide deacetylase
MAAGPSTRRIRLCADDYGIAPGVNAAIRDLIAHGRLNATSVMVLAPSFSRTEADALAKLNADGHRAAIGLHVTLTAPFKPLTAGYRPLRDGAFFPVGATLAAALMRRLQPEALTAEIAAQFDAFAKAFGRAPDFVDGHQHVQLFPQVREAFLAATTRLAPSAWVRQGGSAARPRLTDPKGLLIDWLSRAFRARAAAAGLATNPAFAGTYAFRAGADFASMFPRFLDGLPDGGLVMCHPGFVDTELTRLDPLTALREREYAYLAGDAFPAMLAAHGVALA